MGTGKRALGANGLALPRRCREAPLRDLARHDLLELGEGRGLDTRLDDAALLVQLDQEHDAPADRLSLEPSRKAQSRSRHRPRNPIEIREVDEILRTEGRGARGDGRHREVADERSPRSRVEGDIELREGEKRRLGLELRRRLLLLERRQILDDLFDLGRRVGQDLLDDRRPRAPASRPEAGSLPSAQRAQRRRPGPSRSSPSRPSWSCGAGSVDCS